MRVRTLLVGAALTATAALGLSAVAAPAHAANLDGNCDANEICVWKNANQSLGGMRDMNHDDNNYDGNSYISDCNLNCSINDTVTSLRNTRAGVTAWFFVNRDGGGNHHAVAGNGSRSNLTNNAFPGGGNWNDRISSHCWLDSSRPSWCG